MESLSTMGRPSMVRDITDAVLYLTDAATVTGQILYVEGGAHFGRKETVSQHYSTVPFGPSEVRT